jgi:hypothetical protein
MAKGREKALSKMGLGFMGLGFLLTSGGLD